MFPPRYFARLRVPSFYSSESSDTSLFVLSPPVPAQFSLTPAPPIPAASNAQPPARNPDLVGLNQWPTRSSNLEYAGKETQHRISRRHHGGTKSVPQKRGSNWLRALPARQGRQIWNMLEKKRNTGFRAATTAARNPSPKSAAAIGRGHCPHVFRSFINYGGFVH